MSSSPSPDYSPCNCRRSLTAETSLSPFPLPGSSPGSCSSVCRKVSMSLSSLDLWPLQKAFLSFFFSWLLHLSHHFLFLQSQISYFSQERLPGAPCWDSHGTWHWGCPMACVPPCALVAGTVFVHHCTLGKTSQWQRMWRHKRPYGRILTHKSRDSEAFLSRK